MASNDDSDRKRPFRLKGTPIVVGVGIALFVMGFVITVYSLSSLETVSAGGDGLTSDSHQIFSSSSLPLFIGLVLSLVGVVSATAGPAAFFLHSKRRGA
ncbi:MAG: hypothetical protein IH630_00655 [Thermoplasmata archaeon]|nr:hypothetical protein [Thermoplasmata archaeon]MCJ7561935.1 hypothetical protein [Thermoplasmata archaeon]